MLLISKLGIANVWQLQAMVSRRHSLQHVRKALASLSGRNGEQIDDSARLLEGEGLRVPWGSSGGRRRQAYHLSEEGLRWAALRRDLDFRRLQSDYRKVYRPAIAVHSLLRNELFASISKKVRDDARYEDLTVGTLVGESGVDPVEVHRDDAKTSYLNPDGLIEVRSTFASGGRVRERLIVEADTGSELDDWQIAQKAVRFGAYIHALVSGTQRGGASLTRNTAGDATDLPRQIFFCPTEERSLWVRQIILWAATDEQSSLYKTRVELRESGVQLTDLLWISSIEWFDEVPVDGDSAISIARKQRTPPMECLVGAE